MHAPEPPPQQDPREGARRPRACPSPAKVRARPKSCTPEGAKCPRSQDSHIPRPCTMMMAAPKSAIFQISKLIGR